MATRATYVDPPERFERLLEIIESRRKARGFKSERALVQAAKLLPDAIRSIRRGHAPKIPTLSALAPVLDVPLQRLLDAANVPAGFAEEGARYGFEVAGFSDRIKHIRAALDELLAAGETAAAAHISALLANRLRQPETTAPASPTSPPSTTSSPRGSGDNRND
jgi:transcriptional regulator with XRE-family HTH domain